MHKFLKIKIRRCAGKAATSWAQLHQARQFVVLCTFLLRKMKWADVAFNREMKNVYKILTTKPEGNRLVEDITIDGEWHRKQLQYVCHHMPVRVKDVLCAVEGSAVSRIPAFVEPKGSLLCSQDYSQTIFPDNLVLHSNSLKCTLILS